MQDNSKTKIKKIIILMFITFTAGVIGAAFYAGSFYRARNIQILYISQAELLNIEKARIADKTVTDKQLFFGKPEKAIKLIEQYQKQMSKTGTLVLLTDSKIYGHNVFSISEKAHSQIIKNISQEVEQEIKSKEKKTFKKKNNAQQ